MDKKPSLVFFGNERLATATGTTAPTLRALVAAGYKVEAVLASHVDGVSRQKRDLEIGTVAHEFGIPVILPGKRFSVTEKLQKHPADAGILVAFGELMPEEALDMFPHGIIGIHPSLLPVMRGPTPVETAILNGLRETGVSLLKLTKDMDAGPVYVQEKVHLSGKETKFELAEKLNEVGARLLVENLEGILNGSIAPQTQDETEATYTELITKSDGLVDWSKPTVLIERQVRAYAGWPKSRANIHKHDVILTKVRVAKNHDDGELVQPTGDGWLEIQELIAPSGKPVSGADFLRGYLK